jgi:FSR family fosmidomycin resistance protein-like MFS transporter
LSESRQTVILCPSYHDDDNSMEKGKVILIGIMHFLLDAYMGFFAIYLVIANLDPRRAALIATATSFMGNLLQPFMGYVADQLRGRLPIFLGLCVTALSMSLIGLTTDYGMLFMLVLLAYVGSSLFHPAGANISSAAGYARRDRSFAIFSFIGTIGFSLSQPIFSGFTGRLGTRSSPFLAIPTLITAIVYMLFSRMEIHGPDQRARIGEMKGILLKRGVSILLLFLIMVFRSAFVLSMSTFLAKTLQGWGYSRPLYSMAAPVFLIAGAFGILLCGHLTHLIRPRILLAVTQSLFLPFFLLFLRYGQAGAPIPSFLFLGISGAIVSGGHSANIVMGHRVAPEMTSTISGILMGFAWAVSSFGPTLCAYTAGSIGAFPGMASGLLVLTLFPVAASILSLMLPRTVDGLAQ